MSIDLTQSPAWTAEPTPSADAPRSSIPRAGAAPALLSFERLYRDHYTMIAAYLYRRTASVHVAEDLAAETFLAALRSLNRINAVGVSPHYWLLRTATNAANRQTRTERRRRRREQLRSTSAHVPALDPRPDWPAELAAVRSAVAELPDRFQSVIALHYFASLGVSETATVLGCREGTVKSRLSRARALLRKRLDSAGGRP